MAGERRELLHAGVLPYEYLVLGVAVRAHQLVHVLREHEVAHLAPCLHVADRLEGPRVPEPDALVRRPAPARKQAVLVRRPGDRLHRRQVTRELSLRRVAVLQAPHEEPVVVPARSELLLVEAPLKPADLLLVPGQPRLEVGLAPQVPVQDSLVPRARTQECAGPRDTTDSAVMARELPHYLALSCVPNLEISCICTNC